MPRPLAHRNGEKRLPIIGVHCSIKPKDDQIQEDLHQEPEEALPC